ncbi:MAG: phosphotransferase [Nocardioidaceae bacterium]|nr:phosphotransferase [Nocardioidaceae bacterium]NUS51694.1 phosphotransferase [Nocardioidaceae bacterium]
MRPSEARRALVAARSIASSLGLAADDAVVLHDSNKLTLRLLPCDVLARVARDGREGARFEIDLAQRLAESGCPVAALEARVEPRCYAHDGFDVTLWTFYESVTTGEIPPAEYADALARMHAGMRALEVRAPHFTDRVEQAQRVVGDRHRSPGLADGDREFLGTTLHTLVRVIGERGAPEQLLHGEPHPGNVLRTDTGPLFVDLETVCRGPVELDLAHAPDAVSEHYPGVDEDLLRACRTLALAVVTSWRWDRGDQLPSGRRLGLEGLDELRSTSPPG